MKACGVEELQFYSDLTAEVNGCKWLNSRINQLDPRKGTPIPIAYKVVWAPEPVWTFMGRRNSLVCTWKMEARKGKITLV
jgi:hypothetical protein